MKTVVFNKAAFADGVTLVFGKEFKQKKVESYPVAVMRAQKEAGRVISELEKNMPGMVFECMHQILKDSPTLFETLAKEAEEEEEEYRQECRKRHKKIQR